MVRDDGHGIDPADLGRIFQRFVCGDGMHVRPGTGLGLPIVKAIAEAHGGSVSVKSAPNRGACFEMRLEGLDRRSQATSDTLAALAVPA